LTNGVIYQFYSDIELPNKMDDKPFFNFNLENSKAGDIKTLERFSKANFDIEKIVHEAANLKLQTLIRKELEREFVDPSPEFVRVIAARVHSGRLTANILENFGKLMASSISSYIRDLVTERLSSALKVSAPTESDSDSNPMDSDESVTTEEEIAGFQIVRAIAARHIDPKRVTIRDQKSYCGILIDDNNRKALARMHFNSEKTRHFGTFKGKEELRHPIEDVIDIYKYEADLIARLQEIEGQTSP